jgi:osmotically-inducible protein OsmY
VKDLVQVKSEVPETDEARATRIESALAISPLSTADDIHVHVVNGQATLQGTVDNYFESAEAAEIAGRVSGVVRVDNRLTVRHPSVGYLYQAYVDPYDPYVESWTYVPATRVRSDAQIAAGIRHELESSPLVDSQMVNVSVHDGTATLSGTVDSWKERTAATKDAIEGGAVAVYNELQVR